MDANCKICQFQLSSLIIITSFPENLTFLKTLILSETLLILNLTTISASLEITGQGLISIELMVAESDSPLNKNPDYVKGWLEGTACNQFSIN